MSKMYILFQNYILFEQFYGLYHHEEYIFGIGLYYVQF